MAAARHSKSADVRAKLGYPVIDSDGHVVECTPVLLEFMREVGGPELARHYADSPTWARRVSTWSGREGWDWSSDRYSEGRGIPVRQAPRPCAPRSSMFMEASGSLPSSSSSM